MHAVRKPSGTRVKKAPTPTYKEGGILDRLKAFFGGEKDPPKGENMSMMKTIEPRVPEGGFIPDNTFLLSPAEAVTDFVGPKIPDEYKAPSLVKLSDYLLDYPETYRNAVMAASYKETGSRDPNKQRITEESGNYSTADRVLGTFGRTLRPEYGTGEFTPEGNAIFDTTAVNRDLVRNPEGLFNAVYGDKFNNEGEGYKYRGRSYLQFTGKSNYEARDRNREIRKLLEGKSLVDNPDLIMEPGVAELATVDFLNRGQGSQARALKKKGAISVKKTKDMSQADANLLVVMQVSGGSFSRTTLEGLKKMDKETGVERANYEELYNTLRN